MSIRIIIPMIIVLLIAVVDILLVISCHVLENRYKRERERIEKIDSGR